MVPPVLPLVVYLNAPAAAELCAAVGRHLAPTKSNQHLHFWHPGLLSAGADVLCTTRRQLCEAALALPLISSDYYGDGAMRELYLLPSTVPKQRVAPLLARGVAYKVAADGLAAKQRLPCYDRPLQSRKAAAVALSAVAQDILATLQRLGPRSSRSPRSPRTGWRAERTRPLPRRGWTSSRTRRGPAGRASVSSSVGQNETRAGRARPPAGAPTAHAQSPMERRP